MTRYENSGTICSNEGCRRLAAPAEELCESCALELSLYRRDERGDWPPSRARSSEPLLEALGRIVRLSAKRA